MKKSQWFLLAGCAILFVLGYQFGHVTSKNPVPEGEGNVLNLGTVRSEDVDFREFWNAWALIKDEYVHQPVSERDLFYGAMHGLIEGLDDPYSVFFTPTEAEEFNQEVAGTFSGIGAEIDTKEDNIVIVAPIKNSPASNAGLRANDLILAIDETDTYGMSVNEAVSLIRGEKGSTVTLTIFREGTAKPFDVKIVRDEITIESVEYEMRADGIMVISIHMFNEDTTRLFTKAVQAVKSEGAKGIVLDLRDNPGGLLDQAINVTGFWTGNQTVVIERMQEKQEAYSAGSVATLAGIPTAVLVNGGSASGSEILAGALQDYGLGYLIGEQTYGKGTVQQLHDLKDGSAIKLTIAEWLTPTGRSIHEVGIEPNEKIEYTEEHAKQNATPQLDAAIVYLKGQIN